MENLKLNKTKKERIELEEKIKELVEEFENRNKTHVRYVDVRRQRFSPFILEDITIVLETY